MPKSRGRARAQSLLSKLSAISVSPLHPKIEEMAWKKNNVIPKFLFVKKEARPYCTKPVFCNNSLLHKTVLCNYSLGKPSIKKKGNFVNKIHKTLAPPPVPLL